MKNLRLLLGPAKGPLLLCCLSMVLALSLVLGLAHYRKAREAACALGEAELQGAQSEIHSLGDDLAALEAHLASFNRLLRIGLIGEPEREAWVQSLETIYKTLDLPPTLRYSLAPPRPLAGEDTQVEGAAPSSSTNPLCHDLDIELTGIHEGEFLSFIDRLRTDWQTPFRIETCQMMRESETGIGVKCTLRLFSLPLAKDGQPTGG